MVLKLIKDSLTLIPSYWHFSQNEFSGFNFSLHFGHTNTPSKIRIIY